jgi:hypothetical protein
MKLPVTLMELTDTLSVCVSVLIDDTLALRDDWEAAGGTFIHHKNAEQTLNMLRYYGILDAAIDHSNEQEFESAGF